MNQKIIFVLLLASITISAFSQKEGSKIPLQHKVVMQVTESDSLTQLSVVGQIRNIRKHLTDANIEVVCHANGLDLLTKSGSKVTTQIKKLSLMNVQFTACENTMARQKVTVPDLLPEVKTVPSGLVEFVK